MTVLEVPDLVVTLEEASAQDLPGLIALLVDDPLGRSRDGIRDDADRRRYERAFAAIDDDPAHLLMVARHEDQVVATVQLSLIPSLARRGALRAQVEGVRVSSALRGRGIGAALMRWAVEEARERECDLVQLTSDRRRPAAHRFYERLGFQRTHAGFKLDLRT